MPLLADPEHQWGWTQQTAGGRGLQLRAMYWRFLCSVVSVYIISVSPQVSIARRVCKVHPSSWMRSVPGGLGVDEGGVHRQMHTWHTHVHTQTHTYLSAYAQAQAQAHAWHPARHLYAASSLHDDMKQVAGPHHQPLASTEVMPYGMEVTIKHSSAAGVRAEIGVQIGAIPCSDCTGKGGGVITTGLEDVAPTDSRL